MKQQGTGTRYRGELDSQLQKAFQKLRAIRRLSSEDCEPCEVAKGLYIGSIGAARNLQSLQREGITHVLNASPIVPCFHRRQLRYKVITIYDDAQEDVLQFFEETNRYIAKGRRRGGVLVHCYAGMSRSATFILAYLIACEQMELSEALHLTRKARPCIAPNAGFMAQLERFSKQHGQSGGLLQCAVFRFPPSKPLLTFLEQPAKFTEASSRDRSWGQG